MINKLLELNSSSVYFVCSISKAVYVNERVEKFVYSVRSGVRQRSVTHLVLVNKIACLTTSSWSSAESYEESKT